MGRYFVAIIWRLFLSHNAGVCVCEGNCVVAVVEVVCVVRPDCAGSLSLSLSLFLSSKKLHESDAFGCELGFLVVGCLWGDRGRGMFGCRRLGIYVRWVCELMWWVVMRGPRICFESS